jgi:hypothetical protein
VCPDLFNHLLNTQHNDEGFPDIVSCSHWNKRSEPHKVLEPVTQDGEDAPTTFKDLETGEQAKVT